MDVLLTLWHQLESRTRAAGKYDWLPVPAAGIATLCAGILGTEPGTPPKRMLLLSLPSRLAGQLRPDYRYQGLRVEPLEARSGPADAYIALILDDARLADVFTALAGDVVAATTHHATVNAQMQAFLQRLRLWEALLTAFQSDGLSANAQQGLYGELYILRYLLQSGVTPIEAVTAWVGPLQEPQDFLLPGNAIAAEVKTLGPGNSTIQVSSARQLDDAPLKQLFLACIYLSIQGTNAETLPELVDNLTNTLGTEPVVAELLTLRLRQAGYLDIQAARYSGTGYSVSAWQLLQVKGNFPRLRHTDLPTAIPALTYSLDLSGLGNFICPPTDLITAFLHGRS